MKRLFLAALLVLLPVCVLADAPETATISGHIVDPGGSPLPGVSVTLSGERGDKFGITDENGAYRFVAVVPGDYTLSASLEGLGEASADIRAVAGERKSLDVTLQASIEGEVTVTAETPMVDKFNVTAGTTVSGEIGEQIGGTTRTYYGIINALPGVTADAENDDIQQTRPAVNGAHFADQGVFIDGVDTTFAKFGGSRVRVPTTALTEVSMEAGGSSAEYGRYVGSATNVIVKSGTNRWHADTLWNHQRVDWGADYKDQPSLTERTNKPYPADWFQRCHGDERDAGRGLIPGGTDGSRELEPCRPGGSEWAGASDGFELSLGGPIKRDKFWFYAGYSEFDDAYADRLIGGDPYDISLVDDTRIVKLNLQSSASHSFNASTIDTPTFRNYFNGQSFDYWTPTPHENDSTLATMNWNWAVSSNWFLEMKIAQQETQENKFLGCHNSLAQDNPGVLNVDGMPILDWLGLAHLPEFPAEMVTTCLQAKALDRGPEAGHTELDTSGGDQNFDLRFPFDPSQGFFWPGNNYNVYVDGENLGAWHNGWILSDGFGFNAFPRDQANVGLTQFVGANHELKYGLDYQDTKWEGENARTSFMNGWGYDSYNPFGYGGAGGLGDDSCSLTRNAGTGPDNPHWSGLTTRGRGCTYVDYNSPKLSCEGPIGAELTPVQITNENGQIHRTDFNDITSCIGRGTGDAEVKDTAFYLRDRFTVGDHWTFNVGVRAEIQEAWNDVRRQVVDSTYADPRLNITYDVKGDGRLLVTANWGQYHAMLNQAWISGGGDTAGGMHDQWNGYEGYEVWLFCDPIEAAVFCAVPDRTDTRLAGTVGTASPGYNFAWSTLVPGLQWDAVRPCQDGEASGVDCEIWDHDISPYYRDDLILGLEWQFAPNWALDVKYIDWKMQDMMFSNTQYDHKGRNIFITGNYHDLAEIVTNTADAREANGLERNLNDGALASADPAINSYRGLQVQLNRRFANGWALYNNVSWSETDTTGAGAWWNNTNSSYLENLSVVLTQGHIDQCNANQTEPDRRTGRTELFPVDCTQALSEWLGYPVSMINRRGLNGAYDRTWIYNSFGFKTWRLGNQDLTLSGHLSFQTGTPWVRSEGTSIDFDDLERVQRNPNDPKPGTPNNGVGLNLHAPGTQGRFTSDEYTLNLNGAWGFPMGLRDVRGELRVDVLNVTNQQRRRSWGGDGQVYPVRRFFQRPRQVRASLRFRF